MIFEKKITPSWAYQIIALFFFAGRSMEDYDEDTEMKDVMIFSLHQLCTLGIIVRVRGVYVLLR